eukprot:3742086-Amphidinium_carterae.1
MKVFTVLGWISRHWNHSAIGSLVHICLRVPGLLVTPSMLAMKPLLAGALQRLKVNNGYNKKLVILEASVVRS